MIHLRIRRRQIANSIEKKSGHGISRLSGLVRWTISVLKYSHLQDGIMMILHEDFLSKRMTGKSLLFPHSTKIEKAIGLKNSLQNTLRNSSKKCDLVCGRLYICSHRKQNDEAFLSVNISNTTSTLTSLNFGGLPSLTLQYLRSRLRIIPLL